MTASVLVAPVVRGLLIAAPGLFLVGMAVFLLGLGLADLRKQRDGRGGEHRG